ncbi:hypothetical protein LMH87_004102 [Akanthomyces muscarius]|uniref:Uncharacterized protein n=1 Tax=Akanthomyces muscarius TaxID=2231603 RepID=A0A9W8Q4Z4_AKAMU|nr:hypothetical protein LMH87_004102 [Akanthomyces muscarius]KAJ4145247.1 hypothetical protein LMH87_004102 [Akanthomyces muscarius]
MDGYNGVGKIRNIPLICTVCPESPRFSDVSHLLTHIASKGHLHHETQTKLRAHQDLVAAVILQQYELWYAENGIEALLVERLKAKQLKEAMKSRMHRANTTSKPAYPTSRTKKRSRRTPNASSEYAAPDLAEAIPIYPGLFAEANDPEIPEEVLLQNNDMLSLKGQIWPGMGKMDLANEDMKRTRNQRKPKSAIDKMRRTSEGIEPTQFFSNTWTRRSNTTSPKANHQSKKKARASGGPFNKYASRTREPGQSEFIHKDSRATENASSCIGVRLCHQLLC